MTTGEMKDHGHEALVHEHDHWHVTHNWDSSKQAFEHLASRHTHVHDHASMSHAHVPHEDFESEHVGEAHIHDHDEPVDATAGAARGTAG